jgi:hypothetical protein
MNYILNLTKFFKTIHITQQIGTQCQLQPTNHTDLQLSYDCGICLSKTRNSLLITLLKKRPKTYGAYILTLVCAVKVQHKMVKRKASVNKKVFWGLAPCCIVDVHRCFRDSYCRHHQSDDGGSTKLWNFREMMEAVHTSETSVYFHETTRHYIPEIWPIHTRRRANLKSL